MRPLKTRLLLALLRSADAVAGLVPFSRAAALCRLGAVFWYLLAPGNRRAVRANLARVLGQEPPARMVLDVFRHGAYNYWDTFALPHLTREDVLRMVRLEGREHLDAALADGNGVILASAHLGSVGMAGQIIPALGYRITAVVEPVDPPEVLQFFIDHRHAFGSQVLPLGPSLTRELLSILRRNQVLGLICDRDVGGASAMVDFFGAPASFSSGPAALALRTGAPILPSVCIRFGDASFAIHIDPPVKADRTAGKKPDVKELTQAVARRLEYHIGRHPEQWTVFQPRWLRP